MVIVFNMLKQTFRVFPPRFNSTRRFMNDPKLVLYGDDASPPVRFVLMTASALGVDLDYREIDLFSNEHKTEFYKNINPLQKVPALEIGGQIIRDSHAICLYLCKRSGDTKLYPRDASTKAKIDEMLFFNSGTLFPIDSSIFTDYFAGVQSVRQDKLETLYSALDYLEFHLSENVWLTGNKMYLSDICLMSTVTSIYLLVPRLSQYKKIEKWLHNCEKFTFYEINRRGLMRLANFVRTLHH